MAPRRLIRWKSFWFGILVLGFLGVGWVRSHYVIDIALMPGRKNATLRHFGSWNGAVHVGNELSNYAIVGLEYHRMPAPSVWKSRDPDIGWEKSASYWLLLLLFLVPWSSFLAWRWRRQRVLTKAHDATPAP